MSSQEAVSDLEAFRAVDFNWTRQLKGIWRDQPYHAPLHQDVLDELMGYLLSNTRDAEPDNEPLGRVVIGSAGLGKTHLIGELRRRVWEEDAVFILLDFVGIKDFWSSVALGFLNSLQVRIDERRTQYDRLIHKLATLLELQSQLADIAVRLRGRPRELMAELVKTFLGALARRDRAMTQQHGDVVRAFVLLISEDLECGSIAHAWLQGMDLDAEQLRDLGFVVVKKSPIDIVRGISWLLSLVGPTLIAVDQIDAIISEANAERHRGNGAAASEQTQETQSIIEALAHGLMDLHDVKRRAITVVSCLEASWEVLRSQATVAVTDRYYRPNVLYALTQPQLARALVSARLAQGYAASGYTPPDETYPFAPETFETAVGFTPRQLLKACDEHRQRCLAEGRVILCKSFDAAQPPPPRPTRNGYDEAFGHELRAASTAGLLDLSNEDPLRDLLADVLQIYTAHLQLPDDVDVVSQPDPDQRRPSLHGRLSFVFRSEGDREQHYCFRVLAHTNAIAFQGRLRAAMTASGVDRALKFRHLFILRAGAAPGGAKTAQLVEKFLQAGGQFIAPTEQDLRAFVALRAMAQRNADGFEAWLRARKPLFDTALFKAAGLAPPPFLAGPQPDPAKPSGSSPVPPPAPPAPSLVSTAPRSAPSPVAPAASKPVDRDIPVGHRYERGTAGAAAMLPADLLPRHTAILAGAGSGKTVLLRRIVEEAALLGIPAIVLDTNNDLARLGDQWPAPPEGRSADDAAKAANYQRDVEVVIWTPGFNAGRPMSLALLPDFAALKDDEGERDLAIEMARATLSPYIGGGKGASAKLKEGVLADALRSFAHAGGGDLERLIELLAELPDDTSRIDDAAKLAAAIANQLRAAIATNPLLQSRGTPLDPQVLFGTDAGKTRISVINFSGLASDEARQAFVNQLQMSLFSWIKRNPSPTGRLYVLDEAQNFAPSQRTTPCKESTLSLAAQARKYGLGMILATQTPTGIDHKIISNCTTHFYGRMSSPTTIEATKGLMAAKGGSGEDIGKLSRGEFYFSTEGLPRPVRIRTPICLTWHPANPLTAEQVVTKARAAVPN
ncbi:helicase HerA domain-containing protein [Rhodopseudomonas palustris]|uniref:ATPase n=1 Tax=Rhodopseudomonas palustris (strain BisB18) TaxID=316056 RepID=Q21A39_RHOPB